MRLNLAVKTGEERDYDREKFTSRMALACDMAAVGKTNKEIAEVLDVTDSTVSIWLGDPRSHEYLRALRIRITESIPDVAQRLHILSNEALDEITDTLRNTTKDEIKLKAGFGLLDRAGYTPVQRMLTGKMNDLPPELAARMERTLDETKEIKAQFKFIAPPQKEDEEDTDGEP